MQNSTQSIKISAIHLAIEFHKGNSVSTSILLETAAKLEAYITV